MVNIFEDSGAGPPSPIMAHPSSVFLEVALYMYGMYADVRHSDDS